VTNIGDVIEIIIDIPTRNDFVFIPLSLTTEINY
jgi:hypothetical protein